MFGFGLKSKAEGAWVRSREVVSNLAKPRLLSWGSRENLGVVFFEPHDMPLGDRIVLYGLIRGLKPKRYLEIGVRWGGSTRIVANAMESNGFGAVVGLDPDLSNFRPRPSILHGRVRLVKGYSPEDTGRAAALLGGPLDFVFIDAVHTYTAIRQDLASVLPHLAEYAHILFHDAFHQGINQCVDEFLAETPGYTDLGIVSANPETGLPVSYGGLRLIRKGSLAFSDVLSDAHQQAGLPPPRLDPSIWDHDAYALRVGNPLGRQTSPPAQS
jgi:hypothetical protein